MSKESCRVLSQYAKNTAPMNLKRLELYNNMSGDEGAIEIASVISVCPHLEVFRWAFNRSNEKGARALSEALLNCPKMRRLEFKDNYFGEDGGKFLSKVLECMKDLKELVLADLLIEEDGLIPLLRTIVSQELNLRVIDLSLNCMSTEALQQLVDILPSQSELEELDLGGNYLGSESCRV